jgi:hypothetical protein
MGGPDPEAIEHLLVLVEDIFGQDEIEGALLIIQPSLEEKARGIVRYGSLFSGGAVGKKAWIPLMRTLVSRT